MPDENLLKYIRDGLAMGRTEDVLRPLLKRVGWSDEDVNEAFRIVHGGAPAPASNPASPSPQPTVGEGSMAGGTLPSILRSQMQPQLQPQAESMPQQRPVRSAGGGMGKWIAGGAIALVVVAGGAWAAYAYFIPPSPQQVLDAMFQKGFTDINSMNMDMAVATDFMIAPASPASSSPSFQDAAANPFGGYASMFLGNGPAEVNVSLDASGTVIVNPGNARSSDENIAAVVAIKKGGQSVSFSGSAEVRAIPDATYFNIASFPNLGFFDTSAFEGKWIELPTTTYDAGASSLAIPSSTLSPADAARLTAAAESAIKITKTLPDETIGGVPSYHYAYTIDTAGVDNLIDAAVQAGNDMAKQESSTAQTVDASTTAQMKDQANAALAALGSFGGEIWIGKSDHYPHQITFTISFSTSTPAYGSATGTVNVTTTITDINGGQTVTAPANAESFADLFASMIGSSLSGNSSVPLPSLGATQAEGRDARRISDLHEIQNALELYYNKCGDYPGGPDVTPSCTAAVGASTFAGVQRAIIAANIGVTTLPNDPITGRTYYYGVNANGSAYILAARLENGSNPVFASYVPPSLVGFNISGLASCVAPVYCLSL